MKKFKLGMGIMLSWVTLVNFAGAAEITPDQKSGGQVGIEVRAWFPKISGQETRGGKVDFQNDLGHSGKEVTNVKLNFTENSKWRGNYESYSFKAHNTDHTDYNFGGQAFLAGDELHSEKKLTYGTVNYLPSYQNTAQTNFSWLFGLKWYTVESKLSCDNITTKKSYSVVVPAMGAHYEITKNRSTLYYAELSASPDFGRGYSYDAEIGFKQHLAANAGFSAGYRYLKIYADNNDGKIRMSLSGPFVQLNYRL